MERFDQLQQVSRFQGDINYRSVSPNHGNQKQQQQHSTSPNNDNNRLNSNQKNFSTVSGIDFMFVNQGDGNLSPSNHDHDDGDHHHGGQSSDQEDGLLGVGGSGVSGIGVGVEDGSVKGLKAPPKCIGQCKVCGDDASGMYFGALVCVPCKTFFLRYYGDNFSFVCRNQKDCEINMKTRTQCKYCRMQKCLQVGMLRRVRPSQVQISEGQQLCVVCSDLANGLHFGAITCEGCKKFFRRGLKEHPQYVCKNDKDCVINPRTRNACRYCRYQKCLNAGMCREAIQMGRPSKFRGHSLYNSNLPFPNKIPRTEEPNGTPSGMNVSMATALASEGGGGNQFNPNVPGGSGLVQGPKSFPIPQMDDNQMLNLVRNQQQQQQQQMPMREVKIEPPDYDFHTSPVSYSPFGHPSPHPGELADSILSISNPWDYAIKTMNQEMNSAVSNFLTSNQNELIDQIAQNLKYTTAGLSIPETSTSLTTMSSVCEARPSNTTLVCAGTTNQIVSSSQVSDGGSYKAPSPEELDIMANLQKALEVLEDPNIGGLAQQQPGIIIAQQGTSVQSVPTPVVTSNNNYRGQHDTIMLQPQSHPQQQPQQLQVAVQQQPWLQQQTMESKQPQHHPHQQHLPQPLHSHRQPRMTSQQTTSSLSPPATSPSSHDSQSPPLSITTPPSNQNVAITTTPPPPLSKKTEKRREKVPLNEIVKSEIPEQTPLGVQQDSLESFNNFMELSQQQLIEWIEFLQKEGKTISPNNHTIRAIKQTNSQDFNPEYWQKPELPDENIFFTEDHRQILDQITCAYSAFVEGGHKINIQLTREFQEWLEKSGYSSPEQITDSVFPDFFNKRVVELYTVCSVAYCKKLPGFAKFDSTDQYNIVRLGQSQSRILAAACHWYKREKKEFDYFLSWKPKNALREYKFKDSCLKYAEMIVNRDWDPIESALTNVLVLIATDYPDLKNPDIIEDTRMNILKSFRAYTTAKYGTPNRRIEELFSYIPKLRELGLLHYKWTMVTVLEEETIQNKTDTGTQEDILL